MAEGTGGKVRKERIVFRVWCRHHHGGRTRLTKHHALHERQAIGSRCSDNLDKRGGVCIGHRSSRYVKDPQKRYSSFRRATRQMKLQRFAAHSIPRRWVETNQSLCPTLAEEAMQQFSLATAQISDGLGASRTKHLDDRHHPFVVQPD